MLEANERHVCLIVPPYQAGAGYRVWVFEADGGKEFRSLSLLQDRTLPMNRASGSILDQDGLLYLYNVPRSESVSQKPRRAYLTAFRIGANLEDLVAWDAVAPVLRTRST